MEFSLNSVAYGTVIVGFVALFAVGTPADRSVALDARLAAAKPVVPAYSLALEQRMAASAAAAGPHAASTVAAAAGVTLRSVGFDLPASDRAFPPGPGAELMASNCQSCHSPGMILNQPALTRADWTGEVNKMVHTYKAPISDADAGVIVTYLAGLAVGP